jgi:acyl-CoA synthetase (AMP-forming)/AMP-acid ligase II
VGTAFDGVQLSISEAGTLTVESGSVGSTYLPEPVASLRPGRFETSDLASLSDGRLYLHGRASDVINVAGRKVLPESVEAILRTHPAVRECTVFGVPDAGADRFESIVACVHPAAPVRSAELASFLSMRMPAWQIPRSWWFTTELGANGRGKISRAEWRRRYLLDQGRKNEMQSSPPRL